MVAWIVVKRSYEVCCNTELLQTLPRIIELSQYLEEYHYTHVRTVHALCSYTVPVHT